MVARASNQISQFTFHLKVLDVKDNGDAVIAIQYQRFWIKVLRDGVWVRLDTAMPVASSNRELAVSDGQKKWLSEMESDRSMVNEAIIGSAYNITVSNLGQISQNRRLG